MPAAAACGAGRIWVSRAEPGATRTAARLTALGFTPVVAPVLAVRPIPGAAEDPARRLDDVAALAFTSRNAVAAFIAVSPGLAHDARHLPTFAVGDATAQALVQAGLRNVISGRGDVARLADLVRGAGLPHGAVVLHPGALVTAGDLSGRLNGVVTVRAWPIYATIETGVPTPDASDAVLVHSPRAAIDLARRRADGDPLPPVLCAISEAAAAPLRSPALGSIHIADHPTEPALLSCLQAALGKRRPPV